MKIFQKILISIAVIFVIFLFVKDFIIKTTVTSVASRMLGAELKIKDFSLGLLTQKIIIREALLYNPPGFSPEPFIDIPEIRIHYDLPALMQGKLHFPSIVLNLKEVILIKNPKGELNVNSLKVVQDQRKSGDKNAKPTQPSVPETQPKTSLKMQIDEMTLTIERVVSKDYTLGDPPVVNVVDIPLKNKTFKDITSPEQMAVLILVQAVGPSMMEGAKLYAAATILGVGFLPAGIAGALLGKDNAAQEFQKDLNSVYQAAQNVVKQQHGQVTSDNKSKDLLKARVNSYDVTMKFEQLPNRHVRLTISARKLLLPKPDFANGLLYQISQQLQK